MKTSIPSFASAAVSIAGIFASGASFGAQSSYLFSDNGTGAPVAADNPVNFNIRDSAIYELNPNTNFGGNAANQSSMNNLLGQDQSIQLYAFDGITFNDPSEVISTASLFLNLDFVFPTGGNTSWTIVGVTSPWVESTATWNTLQANITGAGAPTFGTFSDTLFSVQDTYYGIDITSALQAYQAGAITGIAFVNNGNGATFTAGDRSIVFQSADNANPNLRPGLFVETVSGVPEPSSAALLVGGLGLLGLFRRRHF